ncbi:MAG TPA: transposase, partial [Thermoanaerobacterales bacterium]|nr:transposase [Thermoanaerobacterales bacterium]
MARQAREVSPTGYYHIMMRGNNKERIFEKEVQKKTLIKFLKTIGLEEEISIVAYCLMDNHIHLIIKGELDDISMALKRVNIKYAMNFNVNNDRVGHVFQGRYKSEIIADDKYLLQVVRYIHNNPVNAKMVTNISSYKWSSYNEYIKGKYNV